MASKEKEGNKKEPLLHTEAVTRKSLLINEKGEYSVKYNLILVLRRHSDKLKDEKHDFEGHLEIIFNFHHKKEIKDPLFFLNFVGEIKSLLINETKIEKFTFEKHRLILDINSLKEGENKINIIYSGDYNHNGVGLHQYIDPSDKKEYLYTQFEPYDCNRLFPCFDQPDIKATLKLKILAPKEWIVLANSSEESIFDFKEESQLSSFNLSKDAIEHLINVHDIKTKNYHCYVFDETPRISTYLYAVCAGPYYCIENKEKAPTKLRLFMRESLKNYGEPQEIFRVTTAGMKFYSEYFGCPYPFGKYDQIFCPEYNMGAMENVGLITLNEFYCWKDSPTKRRRTGFAITILHELAHMWFGNMVTMKWWDNLWLNESFATFISHLCMSKSEELNKDYNTSWVLFADYKGYAYSADQMVTTHPVMGEIKDTDEAETEFDEIVYEKGSSMVKQMYYYIGDEFFSKGLKLYFQKYKWDNTTFEDFIGKMVEVAGGKLQNLGKLCDEWFKKAGLNEISLDMEADEKTNKITKFIVKQKPCLEQFPNMITHIADFIFIYDFNNLSKNKIFERKIIEPKNETSFDFKNEIAPKFVFLNYNDWGYMKLDLDKKSIQGLKEGLVSFQDPLVKLCIYRSLFDAFRDSKISAIEFLDIVINAIKNETNENNLNTLLRFAKSASSVYMPIKYMKEYKKKLFNELKKLLESQLSSFNFDKDLVKPILMHLPSYADEEDVKFLIELMNLDPKLVSQEDRFRILKQIYSCRNIKIEDKQKMLDDEVKRDKNSDESIVAKLSCNALLPDKKNKELLWKKITTETTSDSLVNMQAIMGAFAPVEQYDLVDDFIKNKYFEVIPELGKTNEAFYVRDFISNCGPSHYTDEETIKKYENLIEKVKDMSQVKRYVSEECDLLKRKRKAQILCEEYIKSMGKKEKK